MFITVLFIIMEITSHLRTLLDSFMSPYSIKVEHGPYKHVGTVSLSQDGWWAGLPRHRKQLMKRSVMERANEDGIISAWRYGLASRCRRRRAGRMVEAGRQLPMEAPGQPVGGPQSRGSHWDCAFISPDLSQLLP